MTDAGPATATEAPPAPHVYDEFFPEMEELGLLAGLEEQLPPGFSAVFEIARMLDDPHSPLAKALAPALAMAPGGGPLPEASRPDDDAQIIEVPAGEEYEAEFIRTWSDVRYVYSWQHLLPDDEFLRRLAKRTLWFPMAKAPRIRAIESGEDDFAPTGAKQKVYVLLDTSASMAQRHRFALAKAVALRFLRRNRRELGEVFVRTFDVDVGPLHTARDKNGYDALIRLVARQRTLGNGTCLQKAILTACADIREQRGLAGAEILIVTDGAAHLDQGRVLDGLGRDVQMHCVKIGHATVFPSDAYVEDALDLHRGMYTARERAIVHLRERRQKIVDALHRTHDGPTLENLKAALAQCESQRREYAHELRAEYGHEIEQLSRVYVEVPDLHARDVFTIDAEALDALRRLTLGLLAELDAAPAPAEVLKRAAVLLSHLALLSDSQMDGAMRQAVDGLREAVESHLEEALTEHADRLQHAGLLSPSDQRDLRVLLQRGSQRGSSLWLLLLRYFYNTFARVTRRRR